MDVKYELFQVLDLKSGLVLGVNLEDLVGEVLRASYVFVDVGVEHQVVVSRLQHDVLAVASVSTLCTEQ